jgi:hypothetical protein
MIIDRVRSFGEVDDYKVVDSHACLVLTKERVENPDCEPLLVSRVYAYYHKQVRQKQYACLLENHRPDSRSQFRIEGIRDWTDVQERVGGISLKTSLETDGHHNLITTYDFDVPRNEKRFEMVEKHDADMLAKTANELRSNVRKRLFREWFDMPAMELSEDSGVIPDSIESVALNRPFVPYTLPFISKVLNLSTGVATFWSSHQFDAENGEPLMCHQIWFITPNCYLVNKTPAHFTFQAKVGRGYLQLLAANPNRAILKIGHTKQVVII